MKSFKNYIKEASGFPTGPVGENPNNFAGSLEVNPSEVGNPAVLRRLNAIVGGIADHEYIVAEMAENGHHYHGEVIQYRMNGKLKSKETYDSI